MNEVYFNKLLFLSKEELSERFIYLGEGAGRRVFAINNDLVIKVAKGEFGIYQNSVENYIYKHANKKMRRYLCPIIWYNPRLVVMRRALPISKTKKHVGDLKEFCCEGIFYHDILSLAEEFLLSIGDIKRTNSWGILNSQKVLIDYGLPSKKGFDFYNIIFNVRLTLDDLKKLKLVK